MLTIPTGLTAPAQVQSAPPPSTPSTSSAAAPTSSRTGPDTVTISAAGQQAAQASKGSSDGDSDAS